MNYQNERHSMNSVCTFAPFLIRFSLRILLLVGSLGTALPVLAQLPPHLPFHLTQAGWQESGVANEDLLRVIEATCRVMAAQQDASGAIIDPYLKREHQYATPYFAFAVGVLLDAGAGNELKEAGILAMEHSTLNFSNGTKSIPDEHGEFFISPLTHALELYEDHVDNARHDRWTQRMKTPLSAVMQNFDGRINNWRTYAMKGEWSRAGKGLREKAGATKFIEKAWKEYSQRIRIVNDRYNLYQDWSSDPQSLAVEAVGRGNLLALAMEGYDGPSSGEILSAVKNGTHTSLFLQAPDGQAPPNGRTDNHIFNDVLYQLAFDVLAEDAWKQGNHYLAGQYRRAANLAFRSILRWQRTADPWAGSFFITKNWFEPGDRIGYQPASQWGNYSGAIVQHLAEAYLSRKSAIPEKPAPAELGGYAFEIDDRFGAFFANAGGFQVMVNLRGASVPKYGLSWTPLGTVRMIREGWDGRLGPADGEHELKRGNTVDLVTGSGDRVDRYRPQSGISFGPEWMENEHWVRIADLPANYQGEAEIHFVHPLLVRFTIHYSYVTGRGGPFFSQEFILTPDMLVTRLKSAQDIPFGLTVPLLENDGRPLSTQITNEMAHTGYTDQGDRQYFIALNEQVRIDTGATAIQSTYGWLQPVRFETSEPSTDLLVYPRKSGELEATALRRGFRWTGGGFETPLASVGASHYIGEKLAGGEGKSLDLDGDGESEVVFDKSCLFVLQMENGLVQAVETDREVDLEYRGKTYKLSAYQPLQINHRLQE
ncbi:hypothetical protein [Cyclobacterium xiamenense]|uniref:hypothetical protein n=1 Tax=Cyclobacterium xiamenense TaxID=1297121 RepID=UPI001F51060B|nr:hypothetical protein [Cyclobacterium xiamenense]